MRLKTLFAPSMADAMAEIRQDFGDTAIIVASDESPAGVKVVIAIEAPEEELPSVGTVTHDALPSTPDQDPIDVVHEALLVHGLPNRLLERLVDASFLVGSDDPLEALTGALDQLFSFHPLENRRGRQPLMLIGAPGVGKTVTIAKLAARATFSRKRVRLITTDIVRAGAVAQLEIFAKLMKVPMHTAETPHELAALVERSHPEEMLLIDTPGVNPYAARDIADLTGLVKSINAETVLVMAAGGDVVDAMEHAEEFGKLGCTRMIATRLDMVRRLGSMLAAADAAGLPFSEFSMTAAVVDGLSVFDAKSLARLLLSPSDVRNVPAEPALQGLRQ